MQAKIVAQSEPAGKTAPPQRRHELDLLRGLVVLALIPYHTTTYWIAGDWAPLHFAPSPALQALIAFSTLIAMPLMFLIAGMGIWYSLRKRTAGALIGERTKRLLVPLIVGNLLLLPPIQYLAFRRSPLFDETLAQFYPSFFEITVRPVFPPSLVGAQYRAHHLWFLKDLFVYTLVMLPLFLWLRTGPGRRMIERMAALCTRPWVILTLALPVASVESVLGSVGGWNRFSYITILFYGYLIAADPRFAQALRRVWKAALLAGLLLFCTIGVAGISHFMAVGVDYQVDPGLPSRLFRLLKGVVAWFVIVGVIGLGDGIRPSREGEQGTRQPDRPRPCRAERMARVAQFLSEGVLPIYLLHLTAVMLIGFYVAQWTSNMWARFLVITVVSLVDTLVVYDLLRRTRVTRFLFGIKPPGGRRAPAQSNPQGAEGGRKKGPAGTRIREPLARLGLAAAVLVVTLAIILGARDTSRSLVGRWQQTLDSAQPATGYIAEFRDDNTWVVTAEGESTGGTYVLREDGAIEIVYADGRSSISGLEMSADRFALAGEGSGRVQVFMRVR